MPDLRDDENLEAFLRRFVPRAPTPLPVVLRNSSLAWWALAAASLALTALWIGRPEGTRPAGEKGRSDLLAAQASAPFVSRPIMGELSVVLRPAGVEMASDDLLGRVLTDPRQPGGALQDIASGAPGF